MADRYITVYLLKSYGDYLWEPDRKHDSGGSKVRFWRSGTTNAVRFVTYDCAGTYAATLGDTRGYIEIVPHLVYKKWTAATYNAATFTAPKPRLLPRLMIEEIVNRPVSSIVSNRRLVRA